MLPPGGLPGRFVGLLRMTSGVGFVELSSSREPGEPKRATTRKVVISISQRWLRRRRSVCDSCYQETLELLLAVVACLHVSRSLERVGGQQHSSAAAIESMLQFPVLWD